MFFRMHASLRYFSPWAGHKRGLNVRSKTYYVLRMRLEFQKRFFPLQSNRRMESIQKSFSLWSALRDKELLETRQCFCELSSSHFFSCQT